MGWQRPTGDGFGGGKRKAGPHENDEGEDEATRMARAIDASREASKRRVASIFAESLLPEAAPRPECNYGERWEMEEALATVPAAFGGAEAAAKLGLSHPDHHAFNAPPTADLDPLERGFHPSPPPEDEAGGVEDEWVQTYDHESGEYYYFNPATRETSWEAPEGATVGLDETAMLALLSATGAVTADGGVSDTCVEDARGGAAGAGAGAGGNGGAAHTPAAHDPMAAAAAAYHAYAAAAGAGAAGAAGGSNSDTTATAKATAPVGEYRSLDSGGDNEETGTATEGNGAEEGEPVSEWAQAALDGIAEAEAGAGGSRRNMVGGIEEQYAAEGTAVEAEAEVDDRPSWYYQDDAVGRCRLTPGFLS